ncbi:MAG: hypothetical protein HC903_23075 [Methylacidiphilales bacterium]|nr:hypothetical protein [Candidatus Methylacidiphilales bacterium]
MIRYDHQLRLQSVSDVLHVLRQMPIEERPHTVEAEYTVIEKTNNWYAPVNNSLDLEKSKPSPLLTGVRVGLLANSVVMGFGVYSLLSSSPAYSETETLYKATEEYQSGDLDGAIALAKSIPSHSNVYPEAQATIQEWQQQWRVAAEKYNHAERAMYDGRWSEVLQSAPQVPDILYWQAKTDRLVAQAKGKIEVQGKGLLAKAYEKAAAKDFNTALSYLNQVPRQPETNGVVEQKIAEYTEKNQIRAAYLLQEAYNKASDRDFATAVKFLEQIPQDAYVYTTAQAKLVEYNQKQRIASEGQKIATSKTSTILNSSLKTPPLVIPNTMKDSFIRGESSTRLQDFQPGDLMQEVNIR